MGKHGLIGKQSLYDHSVRAPFIVLGPEVPKGKRISEDIYIQDAMATSLQLAQVPTPDYIEFNSVMGMIRGTQTKGPYPAIYGGYIDLQRMIRKDGFKLIVYPGSERVLLFDMKNDPEEMNDVSNHPEHKDKTIKMFKALIELQQEMNDLLNLEPLYQKLKEAA